MLQVFTYNNSCVMIESLNDQGGNLMAKTTEKGNVTTLSGAKEARTLAFNKENGLYWKEVRDIMKLDSDQILSFIETNLAERKEQSTLQSSHI